MTTLTRVLVVDDHESWRRFTSSILRLSEELRIVGEAADGIEAVHQAERLQPDLVLLDIGLPRLNGIEAAKQIRKLSPKSQIIFLTEMRSANIASEALREGGAGYIVKYCAARELLLAVAAVLKGTRFISAGLEGDIAADVKKSIDQRTKQTTKLSAPEGVRVSREHEVVFYADDSSVVSGFAGFIQQSLNRGKAVIAVITESHRPTLFQKLSAAGLDVGAAIDAGMYVPLDVADTLSDFMVNNLPDPVGFRKVAEDLIIETANAAKLEPSGVAACGECAPTLLAQGSAEAAIQLEQLWEEISRTYNVDVFCGYVLNSFLGKNNPNLAGICDTHSLIRGRDLALTIKN